LFNRQNSSSDVLKVPNSSKQHYRATAQPKDFFGRPIIRSQTPAEVAKEAKEGDIWYKFKEGYSNAVRKNIKLKDFL